MERGRKRLRTILVSEADHPFWQHHLLGAIANDTDVAPHGATFEDGYGAAEVCDAILSSAESRPARAGLLPPSHKLAT